MKEEVNENQEIMSPRDKMKHRLSSRYPDRAFMGEDGSDDTDAIYSSADEMISEYEAREAEYNEHSKKLTDLFASDPRAASAFLAWANGKDLMEQLIEDYGDDFIEALQSPDGKDKFIDAHKKHIAKLAAAKAADEEANKNFSKSMEDLIAFQSEHNLSDEEAIAVFDAVRKIGEDMIMGIYSPESYLMAYNAMNHDKDVANARTEGEIEGRNTKIRGQMRSGDNMPPLPPSLGGQGASVGTAKPPVKKKRTAVDMFGIGE